MLDIGDLKVNTVHGLWDCIALKTKLSISESEFLAQSGLMPIRGDSKRLHQRYYLRCRVIIKRGQGLHAAYVKNCSRMGFAILSPVQMFPLQEIKIWLDNGCNYVLGVNRCVRVAPNCYECGTRFVSN